MTDHSADLARKGMLADPGDHFKGRHEVELKFAVPDLAPLRRRLAQLNAVPFVLGNEETDVFLDLGDGRLAANAQTQVLREMRPSGRVLWISKGPAPDACLAMDLPAFAPALAMLQSLGFERTLSITKQRDIYFLGAQHVTLDRVEGLGTFVEVAAMTDDTEALETMRRDVRAAARTLGLDDEALITRSYRALLQHPD